jgi:hypothetical protein
MGGGLPKAMSQMNSGCPGFSPGFLELRKTSRLKENRSPGARLHLTQRLVSIVSPGNHLAERKHYRRNKTPSEGKGTLANQLFGEGINTGITGGILNRRSRADTDGGVGDPVPKHLQAQEGGFELDL